MTLRITDKLETWRESQSEDTDRKLEGVCVQRPWGRGSGVNSRLCDLGPGKETEEERKARGRQGRVRPAPQAGRDLEQ